MKTLGPKNSNQLLVVDGYVRGFIADGSTAGGYPVEIGGVDSSGNVQSLSVTSDGYLNAVMFGPNADDTAAYDYPVEVGGVYRSDPTSNTVEDGDVGSILINDQRMVVSEDRVYDAPSDANRNIPVFIPQDRYDFTDFSGTQDDSDTTVSYYVDMQGYSFFSIQYIPGGDGYKQLKVYASNEDVADITAATYTDVTNDYFASAYFDTETWLERNTTVSMKYMRIDVDISGMSGGDTATWDLFVMKKGA